jgi:Predicted integral membrane protein
MHQPQIDGSSHGISGISAITKRLQNLDTRRGDGSLAFYPLFPCLLRLVAYISGSYLAAGLIVSGIASVAAAVLLRRLVQLDYDSAVALRSVWFFLIFPTAYFLHVGYSESLFLALALASVLAARTDRWGLAGLLGAFCWLTRALALFLFPR